jgi:hypothetical protein
MRCLFRGNGLYGRLEMPYIKQDRRSELTIYKSPYLEVPDVPQSVGELNFQFTDLIFAYMENKGLSYQTINDIVGALEGAKLEFYRRVAVPYEDKKIIENGDVY